MRLFLPICAVAMLATGCVTHTVRRPPITVPPIRVDLTTTLDPTAPTTAKVDEWVARLVEKVAGPDTAMGEVTGGCIGYLLLTGRWPTTRAEVEQGLLTSRGGPATLAHVHTLDLVETNGALAVKVVGTDGVGFTMNMDSPAATPASPAPVAVVPPSSARGI